MRMRKQKKHCTAEQKQTACEEYLAGGEVADIAHKYGVTVNTVYNWIRGKGFKVYKDQRHRTVRNLEDQIAKLSRGNMSDAKAMRLAMLTRTLERIKKTAPAKTAPRPVVANAINKDLFKRVLSPDFGLYPYQVEFLQDDARFQVVLKSRQIGFSYALALRALLGCAAGRNQIIISASQEQSDILIDYAIQHAAKLGLELNAITKSELTLSTNVIRALPANQRTIQGFNGDVILDEFAWHQRPKAIWRAVIPSITAVGGRVTVCSTPFMPGNLFWEIAENHKGKYNHYSRRKITIHDAVAQGMTLPGGIEELRMQFDAESWAMMYECQWAEDGSALLGWELLHELATGMESRIYDGPVYVGVDVGRVNDRTAIAVVGMASQDKYQLLHLDEHKGRAFAEQRGLLGDVMRRYQVRRLQIDRTGLGRQLAEEIVSDFPQQARGVDFSWQRKEKLALNMLKLAEDKRLILPNNPAILAQLHAVKRKATQGGRITYDAARDEQGHADAFWALALALEGLAKGEDAGNIIVRLL